MILEYDGRRYHGFQWQSNAPTIQAELERAIEKVTSEKLRVIAASRTDAGVHATGQVVSFRTSSRLSAQTLARALNYYLPKDIAVKGACRVDADFNVRRHALSREYDYRIITSRNRLPFAQGSAYIVPYELNIEEMNKACELLKGKHDFASFAAALLPRRSTVREVYEARVTSKGHLHTVYMVANSFLPHQVRNTVGLLIRLGINKVGLDEFRHIMEAKKLGLAGPAAPAHGLCLTKVNYPIDLEFAI
ncbi:MAG: tRNA pseudouridine(38-40) synthase TruA [Chloroflexi bacterium]|nr:tRNA pseudouridine(38-40) synthase TruA [Chloroflexota bacterium]MBM3173444.1 tRNA pseudouridine(38-40) synthase TruA [Chloroflexota bacterium]MBM3174461.1 tRNA pseudouridine(38-40) synthase TruA [Chloroflexota bacterium]MBM4449589.1 tRNA pseudouridine(38-40) synthase TruA [Chloroflexota bacterium]